MTKQQLFESMEEIRENRDMAIDALRLAAANFAEKVNDSEQEMIRASRALETAARQFVAVDLLFLSATLDTLDQAKREEQS